MGSNNYMAPDEDATINTAAWIADVVAMGIRFPDDSNPGDGASLVWDDDKCGVEMEWVGGGKFVVTNDEGATYSEFDSMELAVEHVKGLLND